jgi:SAM-dependent methyltransferase
MMTEKIQQDFRVDRVNKDRWAEAQSWEEAHWVRTEKLRAKYGKNVVWKMLATVGLVPKSRGEDWNPWWQKQFEDYSFLPDSLDHAIEVGCGPYTNIRLMLNRCKVRRLYLSDPLIRTYINFKLSFTALKYRAAECFIDDHPLEEIPFAPGFFDLVVMINVLDHVRDARLCMENAIRLLRPGGIFILGQDLTNEQDIETLKSDPGAQGHPIKLDHEWFAPFLKKNFDPILDKVLDRGAGRAPAEHYGNLIFAGKRS